MAATITAEVLLMRARLSLRPALRIIKLSLSIVQLASVVPRALPINTLCPVCDCATGLIVCSHRHSNDARAQRRCGDYGH